MTTRHNAADRALDRRIAARDHDVDVEAAERAKRRTLRAQLKCQHYPVCESVAQHEAAAAHDAGLKAAEIATAIAHTHMAKRLMRFSLERLDDSVVRWTTEAELIQVSECDVETGEVVQTHFVAMLPSGLHVCRTHPDVICDATRYVVSEKLTTLLGEPCSEPNEPFPGQAPERIDQ